jgi:4,5-DOPA dioxygenase extradiol
MKMPVLFVGHGSPMNAIEKNDFTTTWENLGKELPKPKAIICISAHWETIGTKVLALENPPTIHDFGGFPSELYTINYPAKGDLELTKKILLKIGEIKPDTDWGLDHGCWSVIKFMYPNADIPVIQISIDKNKSPEEHYELGKKLDFLRNEGVLIIGSGNIIHNLRLIDWNEKNTNYGYDWAIEASEKIKSLIIKDDYASLCSYKTLGDSILKAIPTPEHFIPLLYVLALKKEEEKITFYNDTYVMGSLSMTCIKVG